MAHRYRNIILSALLSASPLLVMGQANGNVFNSSRQSTSGTKTSAFNENRKGNFNDYRQKLNAEYASKTREKWGSYDSNREITQPDKDVKPVTPIVMSDEDAKVKKQDNNISIEKVVTPVKTVVTPQPVAPVQEVPEDNTQYFNFSYLATPMKVRKPSAAKFKLSGVSENNVADGWTALSGDEYNNMVADCLKLRTQYKLCDWAYLMMLKSLADSYCGADTNEATLLMSFIYSQSGYKIRLGRADNKLVFLFASQHTLYFLSYFECDNEKFYVLDKSIKSININAAKYPKEQSLSLWVSNEPNATYQATTQRTLTSKRYPEVSVKVSVNKNLLSFFSSYPTSEVGGNFMTRWAMYAQTPMCSEVKNQLYPQLRSCLSGKSQLESVERLLNWVQTAFVYEYDDKVWGGDRAFFPEETLYYPYCDCEDRAILFTRLVRDLLGLKCVLIYYPGHMSSAVCFTEQVSGDYVQANGSRFTICDPTYIGAPVGRTMPSNDNSSANVILLN